MNKQKVGYWVATGLLAAGFAMSGFVNVKGGSEIVAGYAHLGYPAYVATLLGVWKLLGAAALVAPRFPRLKEWAYAGLFFDLTGAIVSHAAAGDAASKAIAPLVMLGLVAVSWALRPATRRLVSPATSDAPSVGSGQHAHA